jgi:alpha-glucoside transport system permease protein
VTSLIGAPARPAAPVRPQPPRPRRPVAGRVAARLTGPAVRLLLVVVAAFWMVPVLGLLVVSLRPQSANADSGWWTVLTGVLTRPTELTLANYGELLSDPAMLGSLWNTVLIAVPSTVLVVVLGSLAAYALAWIQFPGRDWVMVAVVALLVVPVQVALIPVARLLGAVGLYGSVAGVVLFHVAFGLPFAIFLLRNSFAGIPRDLLEAARMDGGKELMIFWRLVLPIAAPAVAALAVFQFLWVWNDLLVALVFADEGSAPITVALRGQLRQFGTSVDVLASGAFVSMAVPLLVFSCFQRHFVRGVLAAAASWAAPGRHPRGTGRRRPGAALGRRAGRRGAAPHLARRRRSAAGVARPRRRRGPAAGRAVPLAGGPRAPAHAAGPGPGRAGRGVRRAGPPRRAPRGRARVRRAGRGPGARGARRARPRRGGRGGRCRGRRRARRRARGRAAGAVLRRPPPPGGGAGPARAGRRPPLTPAGRPRRRGSALRARRPAGSTPGSSAARG